MTAIDRRRTLSVLAATLLTAAGGVHAAATRGVVTYLQLERELLAALDRRDRAAVTALLAEGFTLRAAATPDALSADEWLQREFTAPMAEGAVRNLTVHEAEGVAIVSFLLDRNASAKSPGATYFVVDVWRASARKLLSRSITHAAGVPPRPARPSGRE